MHFVIVPGIDGSDDQHWQSLWESDWGDAANRIAPASWSHPDLEDWVNAIDSGVPPADDRSVVVVAHSLGCLAAVHWATIGRAALNGLFLVAPPDTSAPAFPAVAGTFTTVPDLPLRAPTLVISSADDPYCSTSAADRLAQQWGAGHVSAGSVGHVNSASDLGVWPFGRALLTAFTTGLQPHR